MTRLLSLWIYGWLGKLQWNTIIWKKDFYSHLNMEGITDADLRMQKDFEKILKQKI